MTWLALLRSTCVAVGLLVTNAAGQRVSGPTRQSQDCTSCHRQWPAGFDLAGAVAPGNPPDTTGVTNDQSCLDCHNGSATDSDRRVRLEHSHTTGITPPSTMKVPEILPLTEGKITCRTCHTVHSTAGAEPLAKGAFLRVRNDASQLCQLCHPGHTKGPELGTHPVGGMPWPVPERLIAAGARRLPDPRRLICQTCHTPHGARADSLLVMGTDSNQLCLTCHTKLRPAMWRPDFGREHPQNPSLTSADQHRAIHEMGTKVGAGGTLLCLSCHKVHHGKAGRYMLAETLHDSRLCLRCHPGRDTMVGSAHDLRISAPNERNRLGRTAQESGPCSACHSFHQFARRPDPQPLDSSGLCATCHQAGRCAGNASGRPFSHPRDLSPNALDGLLNLTLFPNRDDTSRNSLACLTCHDPHKTEHRHFLRATPDAICASCHGSHAESLAGPHDFTTHPQLKNAKERTAAQTGKCGFCHAVHDAEGTALWAATRTAPQGPDDFCIQCHRPGGLAADKLAGALLHPTGAGTTRKALAMECRLPLFDAEGRRNKAGFVTCVTCHDPHGGRAGLLRLPHGEDTGGTDAMCMDCHHDARSIQTSMHSLAWLSDHAISHRTTGPTSACGQCHAVHAQPGLLGPGMWAAPSGPASHSPDVRRCTGCHDRGGTASAVNGFDHPPVALRNVNPPGAPGFLPLVDERGVHDANGHISCLTCHLPHGRELLTNQPQEAISTRADQYWLRAVMPMIRPYLTPNLCSTCHGYDGLRRFLYYHDPRKRQGSLRIDWFERRPDSTLQLPERTALPFRRGSNATLRNDHTILRRE